MPLPQIPKEKPELATITLDADSSPTPTEKKPSGACEGATVQPPNVDVYEPAPEKAEIGEEPPLGGDENVPFCARTRDEQPQNPPNVCPPPPPPELLSPDEEHAEILAGYTSQQLRYVVNRMLFGGLTHTKCALLAGYKGKRTVNRAADLEKRSHIRLMLAQHRANLTGERGGESGAPPKANMSREDLVAYHCGIITGGEATIREQQNSASELAKLQGWSKEKEDETLANQSVAAMRELIYSFGTRRSALPIIPNAQTLPKADVQEVETP